MMLSKSFQVVYKESPLDSEEVWKIESFLLKIFEYGNYSFRRALLGDYHEGLKCIFYLAYNGDEIVGAVGCLFSAISPYSAILGPLATSPGYRNRGIATKLCMKLQEELRNRGVQRVYLGISESHSARKFYQRLGFADYTGVVMKKELVETNRNNLKNYSDFICSELSWQDYAEVLALMCEPSDFMTFDYHQGQFSSRYEPIKRFLPVFPEMMQRLDRYEGCAKVLKREGRAEIVGMAQVYRAQSQLQRHVMYMEFFTVDDYLMDVVRIVKEVLLECNANQEHQILTWIPETDTYKKRILEEIGARRIAILPNTVVFDNKMYNVEVYQA